MDYPDGRTIHVGDEVILWDSEVGIVVCYVDTGEYSDEYRQSDWEYLKRGILVQSKTAGLIHVLEPESTFQFLRRSKKED